MQNGGESRRKFKQQRRNASLKKEKNIMLYNYSFANRKRDLSDVMAAVIKDEPRFISNFRPGAEATQRKHEWVEDQLSGRGFTAMSIAGDVITTDGGANGNLVPGTLIAVKDDPALFKVTDTDNGTVKIELVAVNGSAIKSVDALPENGAEFIIVSTPMSEGSANGDGDENEQGIHKNFAEHEGTFVFHGRLLCYEFM